MPDSTSPLDEFLREQGCDEESLDAARAVIERSDLSESEMARLATSAVDSASSLLAAEDLATLRLEEAIGEARGESVRVVIDAEARRDESEPDPSEPAPSETDPQASIQTLVFRPLDGEELSFPDRSDFGEITRRQVDLDSVEVVAGPDLAAIVARMRQRVDHYRASQREAGTSAREGESFVAGAPVEGGELHSEGVLYDRASKEASEPSVVSGSRASKSNSKRDARNSGSGSGPPPARDWTGELLGGKYRVLEKLGSGGYGSVYLAEDIRLEARVAVKVLHPTSARSVEDRAGFREEARRVTALSHPHIVDWKSFDETEDGTPYFVMELLEGEELSYILKREESLSPERTIAILMQTVDALRSAHLGSGRAPILHLDLKPSNIFIINPKAKGEGERVKVFDFGIGQFVGTDEAEAEAGEATIFGGGRSVVSRATETTVSRRGLVGPESGSSGSVSSQSGPDGSGRGAARHSAGSESGSVQRRSSACTPEYASPEQCAHFRPRRGEFPPLDSRSDLYSLGVMGYFMLMNDYPYEMPESRRDWLRIHREVPARKLSQSGLKLPRGLAQFIDRCLEKNPDDRWSDTQEAYEFLERVARPSVARTVTKIVVPIVLLLLIGTGIYLSQIEAAPLPLELRTEGRHLAGDSIYLGPVRTSVALESVLALQRADDIRIIDLERGAPSSTWRLVPGEGGLLLQPAVKDAELATMARSESRVLVEAVLSGQTYRSDPFDAIWIGDATGRLQRESITIHGRAGADEEKSDVNASGNRVIRGWPESGVEVDWVGATLRFELSGDSADLESVVVNRDGTELDVSRPSLERNVFQFDWGGAVGPARVAIRVQDRAGRAMETQLDVQVAASPIAWVAPPRLQGAGVTALQDGRFIVAVGAKPRWIARTGRPTEGQLSIESVSSGEVVWELPLAVGSDRDVLLPVEWEPEQEYRVLVDLHDSLWHARKERGQLRSSVPILVRSPEMSFGFSVDQTPLNSEQLMFVSGPLLKAQLFRHSLEAARVRVRWSRLHSSGGEASGVLFESRVGSGGERIVSFDATLPGDGCYSIVVEAYWVDVGTGAESLEPQRTESFKVAVKTSRPEIVVRGRPKSIVRAEDLRALSVEAVVDDGWFQRHEVSDSEARVTLECSLVRPDRSTVSVSVPGGVRPGVMASIPLVLSSGGAESPVEDGAYELIVRARDAAGNASELKQLSWQVAVAGPAVALRQPDQGLWLPDGDRWWVRIELTDPNGVEVPRCSLNHQGRSLSVPLELEESSEPASEGGTSSVGERGGRSVYSGSVRFDESWSEASIEIVIEARDAFGNEGESKPFQRRLPMVTWRQPRWVKVNSVGRPGIDLISHLGGPYVFGGRGDDQENARFESLGLGRFSTGSVVRSWALQLPDVPPFFIGRDEVTRREFRDFVVQDTGYGGGPHWSTSPSPARREYWRQQLSQDLDRPITGVDWNEADAFARWCGLRLPAIHEWEIAMRGRGVDPRVYASQHDQGRSPPPHEVVNRRGDGPEGRSWVRSHGGDLSPRGVRDLSGNVCEWTSSPTSFSGSESAASPSPRLRYASRIDAVLSPWEYRNARRYYAAGGSFRTLEFHFGVVQGLERDRNRVDLGFRVAASAEVVRRWLVGNSERTTVEVLGH